MNFTGGIASALMHEVVEDVKSFAKSELDGDSGTTEDSVSESSADMGEMYKYMFYVAFLIIMAGCFLAFIKYRVENSKTENGHFKIIYNSLFRKKNIGNEQV